MLKKTITYTNPFTKNEVTEDHYFHISKADLVEMELEEHKATYIAKDGKELTGMQAKLQRIVDSEDGRAIMTEFKDILRRSYGRKDGDRFLKSQAIWDEFASTEAYSQLIFDLLTKTDEAATFINSVVPDNLEQIAAEVRAQAEKEAPGIIPEVKDPTAMEPPSSNDRTAILAAATPENPVILTRRDIVAMDDAQFRSGLAEGRYKLS